MSDTKSVIIERDIAHAPEKIWRALTQPHLIAEWLMQSDFQPVVGHHFDFTADWGSVGCKVLTVEPNRSLAYSWAAMGVETVVTWTLTPAGKGTHLRMEQSGFSAAPEAARYYQGAQYGWQNFLGKLDEVLEKLD
ncbi:MAG TPA: SRPBCC domain-containing protein [Asticcacaulis sp.]|nr:SRPBCC domain-containing protein [Asticcacaulis sp.]